VVAELFDSASQRQHQQNSTCSVAANAVATAFTLSPPENISTTYFLRLSATDKTGKTLSVNSYWLSTKPDVLDFEKSTWNITPCTSFADYTQLASLPKVKLNLQRLGQTQEGDERVSNFLVDNASDAIAFLVRLKLNKGASGPELLPIRWQDNYFMLLP